MNHTGDLNFEPELRVQANVLEKEQLKSYYGCETFAVSLRPKVRAKSECICLELPGFYFGNGLVYDKVEKK
ncbi:hypothetical protein ACE41H_15795 [Paenibacillus enshidis]|uniref:Uncharacterized protein n=1 Tax=Paenibacillus enshidis TaxID=1458439 RepID=A0ABV5AVJ3_9BACL